MAGRGRPIQPASSDFYDEWSAQPDFDAPQQSGSTNWSDSPIPDDARFSSSATFSQTGACSGNSEREFTSQTSENENRNFSRSSGFGCQNTNSTERTWFVGRQGSRGNRSGFGVSVSQRGGSSDQSEDSSFAAHQRGGFRDSRGGFGSSRSSRGVFGNQQGSENDRTAVRTSGSFEGSRTYRGLRSHQDEENSSFARGSSNEVSNERHQRDFGGSRGRGRSEFSDSRDNTVEFRYNSSRDFSTEADERPRAAGSRGRGGFNGGRDRGGFGGATDRGGFGGATDRCGFGGATDRGGFGGATDRGGFGGARDRGGFGGARDRGGFGGATDRGGFGGATDRGGFGGATDRGGFGGATDRGGFGGATDRGGFGGATDRGGFGGATDRGGFGGDRNSGGFESHQNLSGGTGFRVSDKVDSRSERRSDGFRRGRGGFSEDRGGRDVFSSHLRGDFNDSAADRPRSGFGGSRGRGGFRRELDEASGGVSGGNWSREDYSNDAPRDDFRGGRGGFRSRNSAEGGGGDDVCYKCQQPGHFARECPNADARACFKCGEHDHFASECPNSQSANSGVPSAAHIPEKVELDEIYHRTVHAGINFDNYEKIDVEVSGTDRPGILQSFNDIGLPPIMLENIYKKFNYRKLTPVQKYAIPIVLRRRDLMACAQTGSGKTAAFLLPLAKLLAEMDDLNTVELYTTFPIVLILAPTRELCNQTYEFGLGFLANTNMKIQRIYGGPKTEFLRAELANGCHILVATPGRLKDFADRNIVSLKKTRFLVLDEADQMLDRGFLDSVTWTLEQMPSERQILMFSATFAGQIQALAGQYLQNYLYLTVGKVGAANPDVTQEIREVQQNDKQAELESVIDEWHSDPNRQKDRILIFVETKRQADFVGLALSQKKKLPCTTIHGDREQREREIALREFQRGKNPILVATNVSARGVDINGIELVINMDLPNDFEMYVHRIGRTGRCGNTGKSISFYDHGRDSALALQLRLTLQDNGQPVPDWLDVYADQCGDGGGGGVGMGGGGRFGGASRDMRRGVTRDRYREQPDEGDFADNAFRHVPDSAQSGDCWD